MPQFQQHHFNIFTRIRKLCHHFFNWRPHKHPLPNPHLKRFHWFLASAKLPSNGSGPLLTNFVRLQITPPTFSISLTKMVFTTPFLACLRPSRRCDFGGDVMLFLRITSFCYPSMRKISSILQRQRCWRHRSLSAHKSRGSAGSVGGYSVQASAPAPSGEPSYV